MKEGHRWQIAKADTRRCLKKHRYVALARMLWKVLVLRYYGELCELCGRDFILWISPDDLYVNVHGSPGGTLCPQCFGDLAALKGHRIIWVPHLSNFKSDLEIMRTLSDT